MKPLAIAALVVALALPTAQGRAADDAASSALTLTEGEVRQVDPTAKTLTLRHADIVNLGMPGMTMVFKVADPAMLARVRPGDKVRFRAERVNGALTVTRLETGG